MSLKRLVKRLLETEKGGSCRLGKADADAER